MTDLGFSRKPQTKTLTPDSAWGPAWNSPGGEAPVTANLHKLRSSCEDLGPGCRGQAALSHVSLLCILWVLLFKTPLGNYFQLQIKDVYPQIANLPTIN